MRLRTGYSFHTATGHLEAVIDRLKEIGAVYAPISDRNSTFAYASWKKLSEKAGLKPIYGVELGVVPSLGLQKPPIDFWAFFALGDIRPLHDLIYKATKNAGREPSLTYGQALRACKAGGVIGMSGERTLLSKCPPTDNFYISLMPSSPKGLIRDAAADGHQFMASYDNYYTNEGDLEFYRVTLGRRAGTQTYPRHILTKEEWYKATSWIAPLHVQDLAWLNMIEALQTCKAELKTAQIFKPVVTQTLEEMCREGARSKGCDLTNPIYAERLKKELALIDEKKFEDYFFIIADMVQWAKQRMIVGPARGSSCGSLVCYLLDITAIDPIPYDLIFERFIDTTRKDLPDIDLDFSDVNRPKVFDYVENKYGLEHVARLGTVGTFAPRSAIKGAAAAMQIPAWKVEKVLDSLIVRSSGDSRALQQLEDTLNDTPSGRSLKNDHPEVMIAASMEGHPSTSGQHAAGVLITAQPVLEHVAVDARTNAAMCDKYDAEVLNLLKIDALGLTQLSIFERTLELIGETNLRMLESVPLDDQKAFDVLNSGHFCGIFQFMGVALKSITKQIHCSHVEDLIAITALARPGPIASGGANTWVRRRNGIEPVTYPHPLFEPHLKTSLGTVIYQEQVMNIGRFVGDLSWDDVTQLRKSMSKSLGKEYFNQYGDRWKSGAIKKGIPQDVLDKVWDDLCLSGDTKILNPFPSKGDYKYITLKQLYERGGLGPGKSQNAKRRRQSLLMWDGERLSPFENWGISHSGKKITYSVVTESGNTIRATAEHRFLQPDGTYRQLFRLKAGDFVMSDAGKIPTQRKLAKGTGRGGHNWWHKLKAGSPSYAEGRRYLRTMFKRCQHCKKTPYQETHHIDGDHTNNSIDNLLAVCRVCHKKLHAIMDGGYHRPWDKGRAIFADKIISVKKYKIEDVYDVHMPDPHNNFLAEGIVVHNCAYGSWSFNRSHAVAYGLVSYWCCWLKAHHPLEFSAATLDAERDPVKQIAMLRELKAEGVSYKAIDPENSVDRWTIADGKLIGPLTLIKGIGPASLREILDSRKSGKPLRVALEKRLKASKTDIDSLTPIDDNIKKLYPDLTEINIISKPTPIIDVESGVNGNVLIIGVLKKIAPRDENEPVLVAKRNGMRKSGPTAFLNMFVTDDTDEIFVKIDRFSFERLGRKIVENGRPGKSIYAFSGTVPPDFRMISVRNVRYIGEMDKAPSKDTSND